MVPCTTWMSRLCLAASLCVGCWEEEPGPPGDSCSTVEGFELQVGTAPPSGEGFLPFEDGEDVELATAGQGGFHIFVSYAVRGFDPFGLEVRRAVNFAATGEEITENPERLNLLLPPEPAGDTYCTLRTAQFAILCPTILGRVRDEELEIVVQIEDVHGESTTVTRYARAVCPTEGEWAEQCLEICDGIPVE